MQQILNIYSPQNALKKSGVVCRSTAHTSRPQWGVLGCIYLSSQPPRQGVRVPSPYGGSWAVRKLLQGVGGHHRSPTVRGTRWHWTAALAVGWKKGWAQAYMPPPSLQQCRMSQGSSHCEEADGRDQKSCTLKYTEHCRAGNWKSSMNAYHEKKKKKKEIIVPLISYQPG